MNVPCGGTTKCSRLTNNGERARTLVLPQSSTFDKDRWKLWTGREAKVESCEPPMSVDSLILQCLSKCSQLNLKIYGDGTYSKNANVLRRTLVRTVKLWRLRGVVAFAIHESNHEA